MDDASGGIEVSRVPHSYSSSASDSSSVSDSALRSNIGSPLLLSEPLLDGSDSFVVSDHPPLTATCGMSLLVGRMLDVGKEACEIMHGNSELIVLTTPLNYYLVTPAELVTLAELVTPD